MPRPRARVWTEESARSTATRGDARHARLAAPADEARVLHPTARKVHRFVRLLALVALLATPVRQPRAVQHEKTLRQAAVSEPVGAGARPPREARISRRATERARTLLHTLPRKVDVLCL